MSFLELAQTRFSCRGYTQKPIAQELLDNILEAAKSAPTASNLQAFKIAVIDSKKYQTQLLEIYKPQWFIEAPLVLGVYGSNKSWTRSLDKMCARDIDAAIVMDHITLCATDNGLNTCWVCNFEPEPAKSFLSLPETYQPIAFTPLGYGADNGRPKSRKQLSELVIYKN